MKKYCFCLALFFAMTVDSRAQILSEIFNQKKTQIKYLTEQIAALKVYTDFLQKGYQIAKDGLTLIGDIKDRDFSMHKDYFASLKNVSGPVKDYRRIDDMMAMQFDISSVCYISYGDAEESGAYSAKELLYMKEVYTRLMLSGQKIIADLKTVIKDGALTMKDDERIGRIDGLYKELEDIYRVARRFGNEASQLTATRITAQRQAGSMERQYGITQ